MRKGSELNIRVLEDYELRGMDELNLRVWRFKVIENGKRKGETDWMPLESYHSSIESGVKWIAAHAERTLSKTETMTLKDAIAALERIDESIARHARKFGKALKESK